ncbi:uncharacterized protein LOC134401944 [Elgaria multicarinata webbii]|uniref:uncharacterized protein LOC134401944 n=1 Tax=Elgaria multicarinata webbii TaxID=159646 RepID=UPI002FCD55AF
MEFIEVDLSASDSGEGDPKASKEDEGVADVPENNSKTGDMEEPNLEATEQQEPRRSERATKRVPPARQKGGRWTYVLVYVDDLVLCYEQERNSTEIMLKLRQNFEIKDLGPISHYLSIQVKKGKDESFLLKQRQKIEEMLQEFGMAEAKQVNTPMTTDHLKGQDDNTPLPDNQQYQRAVGKLLFIATVTRPDIAAAVGILSKKVANPSQRDWNRVKRVMRYLKGTVDARLKLPRGTSMELIGFVDADWAGDESDHKSTSGSLFIYNGGTISWASKKQVVVAMSSTEAEYVTADSACQEAITH